MPLGYVTISRSDYDALLREVKRVIDLTANEGPLRRRIRALEPRLEPPRTDLGLALETAEEVARAVSVIERIVRDVDQELTPVRPPSRTDIEAAFQSSVDFAQGKKKPGG